MGRHYKDPDERQKEIEREASGSELVTSPYALRPYKITGQGGKSQTITETQVQDICALVSRGAPITTAAVAVGVGRKVQDWMEKGRVHEKEGIQPGFGPEESPYYACLLMIDQAMAICEATNAMVVQAAARGQVEGDWRAAAHILDRRFHKRWKPRAELKVERKKDDMTHLSAAQLLEITEKAEEGGE
jgi:hypothetical protein